MALFGKKKGKPETEAGSTDQAGSTAPAETHAKRKPIEPDKASKFFGHARTVEETGNIEYALQLWIGGLRQDPSDMHALERVANLAHHLSEQGKGKISKDVLKAAQSDDPSFKAVDRWLDALVQWGYNVTGPMQAVRATELANALELEEQAYWIGERALRVAEQADKPSKELLVKLMEVFEKIRAYDLAVRAGDTASKLDPSDGVLAARVRNMSAAATMSSGGYDKTGEAGGFRKNIKNLDAQRKLDMEDRIVKTEETVDALVASARAEYEANPKDPVVIQKYARRLLERANPESNDEDTAKRLLIHAFELTKQYRFRQEAGKVHIRQARRTLDRYRDAAEADPMNEDAQRAYDAAKRKFLDLEIAEYRAAVENYPTDLTLKYELGRRCFAAALDDEAIPLLQAASSDAKVRSRALGMLGQAFLRIDYTDEAILSYRQAAESHPLTTDDLGMELRYGLMVALEAKARAERDATAAREAEKLASGLALEQFNYRDLRDRRQALKQLVAELKDAG